MTIVLFMWCRCHLIKVTWGSFMSQNNSVLFILTFDWLKIILNLYQLTFFKNNAESNSGVKKIQITCSFFWIFLRLIFCQFWNTTETVYPNNTGSLRISAYIVWPYKGKIVKMSTLINPSPQLWIYFWS